MAGRKQTSEVRLPNSFNVTILQITPVVSGFYSDTHVVNY
jgi:hypothetical protein